MNSKKELAKLQIVAGRLKLAAGAAGASSFKENIEAAIPDVSVSECPMQIDGQPAPAKLAKVINNQWMNQKKIKKIKRQIKSHNKKSARKSGSAGLSSRKTKKSVKK